MRLASALHFRPIVDAARIAIALISLGMAQVLLAQDPAISHEPLSCLAREEYPVVDARIEPGPEIRTAKVYFRAEQFEDFYYVEMQIPEGGRPEDYLGLLPMPSPETTRIIYYIEAIDDAFNGNRSVESDPAVEEGCKSRPAAAYFTGREPGIIIGATKAGMSALPPGFSAAGVAGFITSTGVATGVGGGAGVGVAVGAGVAAAGAGAVVVAAGGGSGTTPPAESPPAPPAPPVSTPSPAPSGPPATSPTIPVKACFQTQPSPAVIAPNESVRFEASCSTGEGLVYAWSFGGAAPDKEGRVVSVLFPTPGTYAVTLTVTDVHGNRDTVTRSVVVQEPPSPPAPPAGGPPPVPTACFNTVVTGCSVSYDASCSTGSIVSYGWVINDGGAFGGPFTRSGMTLTESYPGCDAETLSVTLTVSNGTTTSSTTKSVTLPPAVNACFNANVAGCSVTLNGSCSTGPVTSYSWLIDDGGAFGGPRNRTGVSVTENFPGCSGQSLTVTLTVAGGAMTDTKTSTVTLGSSPVTSCFVYVGKLNSCIHEWNASCSTGPIVTYSWRVDTTAQLPAGTLTFVKVTPDLIVDWNSIGGCSGAPSITVELTVMALPATTDVSTQSGFTIDLKDGAAGERIESRFSSHLGAGNASRGHSGIVFVGERSDSVLDHGPQQHIVKGVAGRNVVEAVLLSDPRGQDVIWNFDFANAEHFVPGSLRAERGQLLASADRSLAFRLGAAGERVRFWFELR
jgi:PKD repeat protein